MKKCNKICIITDRYPLKNYPVNTFLEQLVCGFVDNGVECDVIAPYCSFMDKLRRKHYSPQKHNIYNTLQGNKINVYCPTFFCLSGRRRLGIDFSKIYQQMHYRAALKVLQKINKKYDAFYAHFVVPSALTAAQLGCIYNKPVFFAYGESSIDNIKSNLDLLAKRLL